MDSFDLGGFLLVLCIGIGVFGLIVFLMLFRYVGLWFQAFVSGAPISLFNIVGMSLRKIPLRIMVSARITSYKAGLKSITVSDLETHYLAGGNVFNIVRAMIAADKANIPLTWRQATAIDLAGRDLLEAVKTSVNPKVIDCPEREHGEYITAVAKDGIQLKCRARVTVRTNILQLVGGATEETIIARVGEGIVSAIGEASTHADVLGSPQRISRLVLDRGLDAQTAFEILSIDIADISVGENIGAILRTDSAKADTKIAQAEAEKRRAMAVAMEGEMRVKLVEAEAQIPMAIAQAFREGRLGVMDYYRLNNVQADTLMRKSLAKEEI
ncbi:flotillin-like protein FloA [Candidatus Rhabdochlamydia sp. T3358]|uniref:flotillin-like protein FloA n=1 Tax=Candidatus Rhabdochlamydia sp. T3358 TaxID=2099795 RepID=UPI0010AF9538|nr:flotillin-like protein FloA [Candidatus Rhabdochlamydia sp. T3358]VHO02828.1 SigmaW regulon antibacterial [Candidatus Rhabdochlamydia sp. T3358]